MTIIRTKKKENPFVQIDKTSLEDINLSWKAKGLLAYLLSRPDDWKIYVKDLEKRSKDGRDSVDSGIKELVKQGYIRKHQIRNKGRFKGWEYQVFEHPVKETSTKTGFSGNGETGNGESENGDSVTTNNKLTNNKLTTTSTNTEDDVDKLANHFISLRGKGFFVKHTDYQAIMRVLMKVPFGDAKLLLEDCFHQKKETTNIHSFTYCENYILERYEALKARMEAVQQRKEGENAVNQPISSRISPKESQVSSTTQGIRREQRQTLVEENGEIPDTECDY